MPPGAGGTFVLRGSRQSESDDGIWHKARGNQDGTSYQSRQSETTRFEVKVVVTGQHREMLIRCWISLRLGPIMIWISCDMVRH